MRGGGLPAEPSSFVGRGHEIADVRRLLSTARLVTLTGVGGAGKTCLAVQVANGLRRAYADGVWLVDLAAVRHESLIVYAVTEALGIRHPSTAELPELVVEYLRHRRCLLVLDNCEHLLDGCAAFVDGVLRAAADLQVLCTSRQPLGTAGEYVWAVLPLPAPDPAQTYVNGTATRYPSITLFAARATAAVPGFALTPDNQDLVAQICHRLDGLPLAIELAAAQVRTLSLDQLADGLEDRFRLLSNHRETPTPPGTYRWARHQTLEATFDWSFELCSPAERTLWTRVSVFVGSFEPDAVEAVCASDDLPAATMLDVVAGLVDKSILIRTEASGRVRYRLLDTVREYGRARLAGGSAGEEELRRRHRDWYRNLVEPIGDDWLGPGQEAWVARLRLEYPNLRAALQSYLDAGDVDAAQRLAADLHCHWLPGGALHEGRLWLRRVLDADTAARTGADAGTGTIAAAATGTIAAAAAAAAADAAAARPTAARVQALSMYYRILTTLGDRAGAAEAAAAALDMARVVGDPALIARGASDVGNAAGLDGDLPRAYRYLEEALDLYRDLGLVRLGTVHAHVLLGTVALAEDDVPRATRWFAEAVTTCRRMGDRWWLSFALGGAARAALAAGNLDAANGYAREALRLAAAFGNAQMVASTLDRLAWIASARGDYERGVRLAGATRTMWRQVGRTWYGAPKWIMAEAPTEAACRRVLGDAEFEAAREWGARLSIDQAIAYALQEEAPVPPGSLAPAGPLTPREREVAELIAQGLSNKEIAARLVISTRTAESHVENILRKLGYTSRTQVVAWVARGG